MPGKVVWTLCVCGKQKDERAKLCRDCYMSSRSVKPRTCPQCAATFVRKQSGNLLRFCSRRCSALWHKGRPASKPRPVTPRHSHVPVVSRPCSVVGCNKTAHYGKRGLCGTHLSRLRNTGSLELSERHQLPHLKCEHCRTLFTVPTKQRMDQRFCSRLCMGASKRSGPVPCETCGVLFRRQDRHGSTFCSRKCAFKSERSKSSGNLRTDIYRRLGDRLRGKPATYPMRRSYYKGVPFRSSWEVRAAKSLDALGIQWEFESKRFDLGSETYAPDFYLPTEDVFWEIKGYYGPKSQRTVALFREKYPQHRLVLIDEVALEILEASATLVGIPMRSQALSFPAVPHESPSGSTEIPSCL